MADIILARRMLESLKVARMQAARHVNKNYPLLVIRRSAYIFVSVSIPRLSSIQGMIRYITSSELKTLSRNDHSTSLCSSLFYLVFPPTLTTTILQPVVQKSLNKVGSIRETPKLLLHSGSKHTIHRRQNRRNTCKFAIKITRIRRALDGRQERCRNLLVINVIPIDVLEESMAHDFLSVGWAATEALVWFTREEFLEDGDAVAGHVDWVEGLIC